MATTQISDVTINSINIYLLNERDTHPSIHTYCTRTDKSTMSLYIRRHGNETPSSSQS